MKMMMITWSLESHHMTVQAFGFSLLNIYLRCVQIVYVCVWVRVGIPVSSSAVHGTVARNRQPNIFHSPPLVQFSTVGIWLVTVVSFTGYLLILLPASPSTGVNIRFTSAAAVAGLRGNNCDYFPSSLPSSRPFWISMVPFTITNTFSLSMVMLSTPTIADI